MHGPGQLSLRCSTRPVAVHLWLHGSLLLGSVCMQSVTGRTAPTEDAMQLNIWRPPALCAARHRPSPRAPSMLAAPSGALAMPVQARAALGKGGGNDSSCSWRRRDPARGCPASCAAPRWLRRPAQLPTNPAQRPKTERQERGGPPGKCRSAGRVSTACKPLPPADHALC